MTPQGYNQLNPRCGKFYRTKEPAFSTNKWGVVWIRGGREAVRGYQRPRSILTRCNVRTLDPDSNRSTAKIVSEITGKLKLDQVLEDIK